MKEKICITCNNKFQRKYGSKYCSDICKKESKNTRRREYKRLYYQSGKGFESRLKYRFGITTEDYNNIFNKQNGCCAICNKHQSELKRSLAVDHCHKTGRIRGLLCTKCNIAVGNFNDDMETIENAAKYLRGVSLNFHSRSIE